MLRFLISILLLFALNVAQGQAVESTRLKVAGAKENPDKILSARLTLFNSEYVSSGQTYFREGAEDNNRGASVGVLADGNWRSFGARLNAADEYSATERWNYLKLYEANLRWRPAKESTVTLGRKLERWDEWSSEWRQGVFQPRYMMNKMRMEEAGLVGLFYNHDTQPVAFAAGFLPVHVPDFGAHFYVENDKFSSRNPWFNPPAAQFEYRQVFGDIRYSLDKPSVGEAVNHMGGIAKIELNGVKNYFGRLSAAYKPMPQFLLGFPSRNRVIITPTDDFMSVRVTPRLAYHTLLSHDSVLKVGAWTLNGSVTREVPDGDASPEDFTAQQVSSAWITSASVSRAIEAEGPFAARMKIGFLKVDGGDAPDKGDFASGRSLFEPRYHYNEAYSLTLTKPWRSLSRFPLDTGLRLVYDRLQNGGVATFSAGLNLRKDLRADFEADFLGLFSGPAKAEDGFLALYRSNDRVGLGLSYVY